VPDRILAHSWDCAALGRPWSYSLRLPEGPAPAGGWPLLIVLHGAGRSHRTLAELGGDLPVLRDLRCALLLPDGALGFWTDSPAGRYRAMLLELIALVRATQPVTQLASGTAIGGWSMGGYGAVRFAQEHPEAIAAVGSIIALLDFPNPAYPPECNFPVPPLFGAPSTWPQQGCLAHADRLRGLAIGQFVAAQAFDADMNHAFHRELERLAIPHRYEACDGIHDWAAVRTLMPQMLHFLESEVVRCA
jgi:S-formylglutathione hydrolase FrmB